jgi:hypothetical protein
MHAKFTILLLFVANNVFKYNKADLTGIFNYSCIQYSIQYLQIWSHFVTCLILDVRVHAVF